MTLGQWGTPTQPITVVGVPGPNGEPPVIDGNGATTRLALNYWSETRGVIKIGGASIPADLMPMHIVIDGLEIRGGRPPYSFTDDKGDAQDYPNNAAAVYVEKGEKITIRNCVLRDCGNGLFVASSSSDVLVEGNYLYDNGNTGSIYEHNSYTEAAGITFQCNRYGPLRAGASGNNLKDRSAGTVIRYNWMKSGAVNSFNSGYTGSLLGAGTSVTGTDPGFIDATVQNFRLASDSDSVNAAAALDPATTANHAPVREYRKHQHSEVRRQLGVADLGAFEYSPYAAWQHEEFGVDAENAMVSGESADPDDDLISNLLEFAFLLDPQVASSGSLLSPSWVTIGDERYFAVEFQRRAAPSGLMYTAEVTEDLVDWLPGTVYTDTSAPTATAHTTDASELGLTRVRLNTSTVSMEEGFFV